VPTKEANYLANQSQNNNQNGKRNTMTWIMAADGSRMINSDEVAEFRNAYMHLCFRYKGAVEEEPLVVLADDEDPQINNDLLWKIFLQLQLSPKVPLDLMKEKEGAKRLLKEFPLPKRPRGADRPVKEGKNG